MTIFLEGGKMRKVIYWTSRAIRVEDNPALFHAYQHAVDHDAQLEVVFFVWPLFDSANMRNMDFLLHGVLEMANKLTALHIPLRVYQSDPIQYFSNELNTSRLLMVVTEQHVLKPVKQVHQKVKDLLSKQGVAFDTVNTAMVVPIEMASDKLEYAARTFRPKIMSVYKDYLPLLPLLRPLNQACEGVFDQRQLNQILESGHHWQQLPLSFLVPGETAAKERLAQFIQHGLPHYHRRNEYHSQGQSMLSAYLHFGMLSPKIMIREVEKTGHANAPLFVEEALVRRELAENYCHYNENYDSLKGAWPWAIETLKQHLHDPREYEYTLEQFEAANTHDDLWNFCQKQVLDTGCLHSYLRMYWAKMVLYWTKQPQDAIKILIHLNDTYMLDGRDPNGYTGIMWSVAGVHDRPWFNKPITGLIRPMSKNGTLKKTKLDFKIPTE